MRIHRVWALCAIVLAAMSVVSCAEGQFGKVMQNMAPGMCGQGKGAVSAAPEYCLYVNDVRVLSDGQAEVGISIVSRTNSRYFLALKTSSLIDNLGNRWELGGGVSGIGWGTFSHHATPFEPGYESPVTLKFTNYARPRPGSTFVVSGEILVFRPDSTGQADKLANPAVRGFRVTVQQVAQRPVQP